MKKARVPFLISPFNASSHGACLRAYGWQFPIESFVYQTAWTRLEPLLADLAGSRVRRPAHRPTTPAGARTRAHHGIHGTVQAHAHAGTRTGTRTGTGAGTRPCVRPPRAVVAPTRRSVD
jgi:hypothetical protein